MALGGVPTLGGLVNDIIYRDRGGMGLGCRVVSAVDGIQSAPAIFLYLDPSAGLKLNWFAYTIPLLA